MKSIIKHVSLVIFCTHYMLFSMYSAQILLTREDNAIIDIISTEINQKYSSNYIIVDTFKNFTDQDFLDMTQIAFSNYQHMPDTVIKTLCERNNLFARAINRFIYFASQNLKLVTADNMNKIYNPEHPQPTLELDELALPIRKYVMHAASQNIGYTYDIILKDQHKDDIYTFDICEATDQAVTASFKDPANSAASSDQYNSLFILWDLKTGKVAHTFAESDPIHLLAFNPNGSCIAAAMYKENIIKIWSPRTTQLLHKLTSLHSIESLAYAHPTGAFITATYDADVPRYGIMTQWALTNDALTAGHALNCSYISGGRQQYSSFIRTKYKAFHPKDYISIPRTELHITKRNCYSLYLCIQLIKNENKIDTNKIECFAPFQQLTDIERQKVYAEIQRKPIIPKA